MNTTAATGPKESKKGAGLAGASGGTLVAVMASGLDDSNPVKDWLLYAAPTFSILLSAAWIWAQVTIGNHFRDKQIQLLIDAARRALEAGLNNPNTSEAHKIVLRKQLEELELVTVKRLLSRVDSLEIITAADVDALTRQTQPTQ